MGIQQTCASDVTEALRRLHADESIPWPRKYDLFGVHVSSTTYAEVVEVLVHTAKHHQPALVDFTPVSVLLEAADNLAFRSKLNSFDLVCPDGQPVRWCLNHFYKVGLKERVCGTTTMLLLCEAAARENLSIYLYGSTPDTLQKLQVNLLTRFPRLRIAGAEAPPFRPLTAAEWDGAICRINDSGAAFLFLGLGSPKQETLGWEHRSSIKAVQLCVGAAYDFIARTKKRAPHWMQGIGLEWVYRMCSEPVRLGRRYTVGNARFVILLLLELLGPHRRTRRERRAAHGEGVL